MIGTSGNDRFKATSAAENFEGLGGDDQVSYMNSSQSVMVRLDWGRGYFGDANGDRYESIEDVLGSEYNDTIVGNSADNTLEGYNGNDRISGLAGADVMDGGLGLDTVGYGASNGGVYVDLQSQTARNVVPGVGHADGDVIRSFENVDGSRYRDYLYGSNGDNVIYGDNGDDRIYGQGGADRIDGGHGRDTLVGGAGRDRINGAEGDDWINAGFEADTIFGSGGADTIIAFNGEAGAVETIYGDGSYHAPGADTFVFGYYTSPNPTGVIEIMDFQRGLDTLDFGWMPGVNSMRDLAVYYSGVNDAMIIEKGDDLYVRLYDIDNLSASDFDF